MKLGKVIGTVVATAKHPSIKDTKILMMTPLDDDLSPSGPPIAAIDIAQAAPGNIVYWVMSREAALALPTPFAPVDAVITGIVDSVDVNDVGIIRKEEIFIEEK